MDSITQAVLGAAIEDYIAPTSFYFKIDQDTIDDDKLSVGMHPNGP